MADINKGDARALSRIEAGEVVKLISIAGGSGLQSRLAAMGLFPGSTLEVRKNTFHGPLVVMVKGSRLVLGRGMTHKIMVV